MVMTWRTRPFSSGDLAGVDAAQAPADQADRTWRCDAVISLTRDARSSRPGVDVAHRVTVFGRDQAAWPQSMAAQPGRLPPQAASAARWSGGRPRRPGKISSGRPSPRGRVVLIHRSAAHPNAARISSLPSRVQSGAGMGARKE